MCPLPAVGEAYLGRHLADPGFEIEETVFDRSQHRQGRDCFTMAAAPSVDRRPIVISRVRVSAFGVMLANPSEDIRATRDIVAVIQGGVVLDRSRLVFDEGAIPVSERWGRGPRTEGAMDQLPASPRMRPIGLSSVDQSYCLGKRGKDLKSLSLSFTRCETTQLASCRAISASARSTSESSL